MNSSLEKIYKRENDIWGLPQTYKGVKIHPIKIKDVEYQELFNKIFTYPKNYIADKDIIKMTYMKYFVLIVSRSLGESANDLLTRFFSYVFKDENVFFEIRIPRIVKSYKDISLKWGVRDIDFDDIDFDKIREIILEQNGLSLDYIESYMPDLEDALDFFNSKASLISYGDEILVFCSLAGKTINEISDYTVFQFQAHLRRLILLEDYRIYKPLVDSGQITLKSGEVQHYGTHIKKLGRYDNLLISKDEFVEKNADLFSSSNK